jgi:uncharacterized protein (DUF924 family)
MDRIETILGYWIGDDVLTPERQALWFGGRPETDAFIRREFAAELERGARGELGEWTATPRGRLALVVVLDQFSRNAWRGTPRAFAQDPLALATSLDGLARGDESVLRPVERAFLYLPLEHAEDPAMQERSVECFTRLADEAPALAGFLDYAREHRDLITRFGRFPARNAVLGRPSTAEELAWLAEGGARF